MPPSQADLIAQLQTHVDAFEEARKYAEVNAKNFVAQQVASEDILEGDFNDQITAGYQSSRAAINSLLTGFGGILTPHLFDWKRLIGSTAQDVQGIITDLYDYFIDNTLHVLNRDFTYGSPVADGGNTGDGVIKRLTVDRNALDIENITAEGKKATVTSDQTTGAVKGQELFLFEGDPAGRDSVETRGSGAISNQTIRAMHPDNSLVLNSSFDAFAGSITLPTSIPNWTSSPAVIGDGTDYEFNPTTVYLPARNDNVTPHSLEVKLTGRTLSQKFVNIARNINPNVPVYLQIAYNEQSTATGTLEIKLGTTTKSVTLVAGAGWKTLSLDLTSTLWFENFNEDDLDVEIVITLSAGTILLDDVICENFSPHNGTWYAVVPGQTPWLLDDFFTWTDTEVGAKIQLWFFRLYGRFLPHDATPAIADP